MSGNNNTNDTFGKTHVAPTAHNCLGGILPAILGVVIPILWYQHHSSSPEPKPSPPTFQQQTIMAANSAYNTAKLDLDHQKDPAIIKQAYQEAATKAEIAIKQNPENAEMYDLAGRSHFYLAGTSHTDADIKNEAALVIVDLEKFEELIAPKNLDARLNNYIARSYEWTGKPSQARVAYQRTLDRLSAKVQLSAEENVYLKEANDRMHDLK